MKKLILLISLLISVKQANAQFCFSNPPAIYSAGPNPSAIVTADFNKDGNADLAVTDIGSDDISILIGNGLGSFSTGTHFSLGGGSQPLFLCAADFNKDGNIDLVTANSNSNDVSVLLGTGTGTFGSASLYTTPGTPFGVCAADFNGDGFIDLATANNSSSNVTVLLGTGTGSFGAATTVASSSQPYAICSGDFNLDGKIDLAYTDDAGSGNTYTLFNTTTSTLTAAFSPPIILPAGTNPHSIISSDINADGNPDIVIANEGSNTIMKLLGNGTGGFSSAPTTNINGGGNVDAPRCVTSADFNNDGIPDLAAADYGNSSGTPYYISLILNSTMPTGQAISLVNSTAESPHGICTGDFNNDGVPDIAIANEGVSTIGSVAVLLNTYPTVKITGSTNVCYFQNTTLTATGASTYSWSTGVSTSSINYNSCCTNTVSVTGTNSGCSYSSTAIVTVTVNSLPNISISATSNNICPSSSLFLNSATLTASNASTYTWSANAGNATTASIVVTPTVATTYSVTGTSAAGCQSITYTFT